MSLPILHHGGAVYHNDRLYRLKELIPLCRLADEDLRIRSADPDEASGGLCLTLSDDTIHRIPLPVPCSIPEMITEENKGPADLIIGGASQLLTFVGEGVGLLDRGIVACGGGRILAVTTEERLDRDVALTPETRRLDARGGILTPGLVDPHTHPVFAGQRFLEFGLKAEGKTYMEIHKAGGGILSTVRATRAASFEEFVHTCRLNLTRLFRWGVTTCEGKSGYALDVEGELRLLEVMREVSDCHPMDVEATLLGAHSLPPEYKDRRREYVALVTDEMIPRAVREKLSHFCDAYCEDGAFSPEEVRQIFSAARAAGLGLRLHTEQFTNQEGAALAAELGAASADHLEAISPRGIAALAASGTTAVLLPGACLSCRCPWPPARQLLDAGAHVALGTDLNPGSSMTSSLPLMMSLACMQMKMSCEEAWRAVTCEAARSLAREDIGRIAPGCRADLVIFEAPDYRYIPYHYADNHARIVIKNGQVVVDRSHG